MSLLSLEGMNTFYGQSHILFDVSLTVEAGECVCLLGRNGAGKTTTFRSILGLTPPASGKVIFAGEVIGKRATHHIARTGVGWIPEERDIFPTLSVAENLEIVRPLRDGAWTQTRVYDQFPQLLSRRKQAGGSLSGGEQQMLTIARTLLLNPLLLLLDEPSEGLAPLIVEQIQALVATLQAEGMTILMAEQNVGFVQALAQRVYVLDDGRITNHIYQDAWATDPDLLTRQLSLASLRSPSPAVS